jgi:hypothetical protein
MQLKPLIISRQLKDGHSPVVCIHADGGKLPPAQCVEIVVGPGFPTPSSLVQVLEDLAATLRSTSLDLEQAP